MISDPAQQRVFASDFVVDEHTGTRAVDILYQITKAFKDQHIATTKSVPEPDRVWHWHQEAAPDAGVMEW